MPDTVTRLEGTHPPLDTPPVAELHLHLEGTLEPETILTLAEEHGMAPPADDVDALRTRYRFSDLQAFLDLYYENLAVLRTEDDFAAMTDAYLRRAASGGVRHAEVFLDPQAHARRGVPVAAVLEGVAGSLTTGGARYGVSTGLIVCFLRDLGPEAAMATFDEVLAAGVEILGVGLDSSEVGYPPGAFAAVFGRARALGLLAVAHAGEEGPAAYVTEALDLLGVRRVDHGVRSLEDEDLVARLVAGRIPLTVCPLSNVRLGGCPDVAHHPVADMLAKGLMVTVNSDDPAYFGGYIEDNLRAVADSHDLGPSGLARLARNSFDAAVLSGPVRRGYVAEVDAWEDGR